MASNALLEGLVPSKVSVGLGVVAIAFVVAGVGVNAVIKPTRKEGSRAVVRPP